MKPHYIDRTYGETDHWYWVNRYFLLVLELELNSFSLWHFVQIIIKDRF